jgi:AraC-like DNA-binding protein
MDNECGKMDDTCVVLEALCASLCRDGLPPIPYIGPAGGLFRNPPAPHIELAFMLEGAIRQVRTGEHHYFDIPVHHVSLHNVHFGNVSASYPGVKALCLFIDISAVPALEWFGRRPFAHAIAVHNPFRFADAFHRAKERCMAVSGTGGSYPCGDCAYDPLRDRATGVADRMLLLSAVLDILGTAWQDAAGAPPHGLHANAPLAVRLALDFMISRYADADLRLADIARAAHLSNAHFGRAFRESTGESPMKRLQALRVERACLLLNQPSLRIHEVAALAGFKDPYHFSRIFRERIGKSPRQYRARPAPP